MNINAISTVSYGSYTNVTNKKVNRVASMTTNLLKEQTVGKRGANMLNKIAGMFSKKSVQDGASNLLNIFESLVKIPSPSLKEEKVSKWIVDYCKQNKIKAGLDDYGNVRINIPATDKSKKPMLLSSHMDVVGDSSPINLVKEGEYYKTDGKRTLGADDKAGIATALCLAHEIINSNIKHGGLELMFTRDEESGMSGIEHAKFDEINSKHVLVLDGDKLGRYENAGAGYTLATLSLKTPYGGHSGIDIHEEHRLNAAKMIAELISELPQGVYHKDESGTVTSINLGTIIAGNIQNTAAKIVEDKIVSDNYFDFFMDNSVTNVINTNAKATYSIRSSSTEKENELRKLMQEKISAFNEKYKGLVSAEMKFEDHLPKFEKSDDSTMEDVYRKACAKVGMEPSVGSFHAGAETHIYANQKNKNGEKFSPVLMGVADIYNMHSPSERVNFKTLEKGYELIKQMFIEFNNR
ncbi:M20/M25/M40 family metallo-hydrolase [bacterium]|nr:M20/M25/M40 family metallo-hydrolase [bacterium]